SITAKVESWTIVSHHKKKMKQDLSKHGPMKPTNSMQQTIEKHSPSSAIPSQMESSSQEALGQIPTGQKPSPKHMGNALSPPANFRPVTTLNMSPNTSDNDPSFNEQKPMDKDHCPPKDHPPSNPTLPTYTNSPTHVPITLDTVQNHLPYLPSMNYEVTSTKPLPLGQHLDYNLSNNTKNNGSLITTTNRFSSLETNSPSHQAPPKISLELNQNTHLVTTSAAKINVLINEPSNINSPVVSSLNQPSFLRPSHDNLAANKRDINTNTNSNNTATKNAKTPKQSSQEKHENKKERLDQGTTPKIQPHLQPASNNSTTTPATNTIHNLTNTTKPYPPELVGTGSNGTRIEHEPKDQWRGHNHTNRGPMLLGSNNIGRHENCYEEHNKQPLDTSCSNLSPRNAITMDTPCMAESTMEPYPTVQPPQHTLTPLPKHPTSPK
ncbi:hypothetical protein A4A49_61081, partial [Nicotiana attenuata]